jgi:uroporphyrinogen decarboxylase
MQNDLFLRALRRQPVEKTPVWIMRQAGRYLPEYRASRAKAGDFLTLCKTPELACEVTLQPVMRFDLDAAILFSDILTIPDAMGLGLYFSEGEGPLFRNPIRSSADIQALGVPDPEQDLAYVMQAVRLIRHELNDKIPLIGFAGSPWTLATYMIEGGPSKNFSRIKTMAYREPQALHQLLSLLTKAVSNYLLAQIAAGVQAVMIFDTWGGILSTDAFAEFSLRYLKEIITNLQKDPAEQIVPSILFTKGGANWLEMLASTGANALGIDWTINIDAAHARVGGQVALQGNMDPTVLYATPERIQTEVATILQRYGKNNGHIFNLGHGILPDISPDNVAVLIDAVHELSKPYHQR